MMGDQVEVYECLAAFVYSTPEGMRETSLTTLYTAKNKRDAISDGVSWAKGRVEGAFSKKDGFELACIKVWTKRIGPIENGQTTSRSGATYFEWKYDWPGTLEDRIHIYTSGD